MNKERFFLVMIMALFLSLMINSCNKDDDEPDNLFNGKTTAVFNPDLTYGTMTDQDGNEYKTITIGTQTWMAENLRTTKYRDGSEIPNVTDNTEWIELATGACCNYNNTTSADTIATYGRLYNWYAVTDSRNIAPEGWHLPTESEWWILLNYLDGSVAGSKMKETGTKHWITTNTGATNESGFTALPSGNRSDFRGLGECFAIGQHATYWSSTPIDPEHYLLPKLFHEQERIGQTGFINTSGFAVRLVKD